MTLIATKRQQFLYKLATATVYTAHVIEMDDAAAAIRAQIAEMTGRSDRDTFIVEFAFLFTFTADLEFAWPTDEEVPDDVKAIEKAWLMHADGHSAYDVWLFWSKAVPTWVADEWVSAVVAGMKIWKPKEQVTPTPEALAKDPN